MKRILFLVLALMGCEEVAEAERVSRGASSQDRAVVGLVEGFKAPPEAAKPRAWWHWIDGNVTGEGITADLEWMDRIGIAGFQLFDVEAGTAHVIDDPVIFHSEKWSELVGHAANEARRLGLEMTLHTAAGWSQTGGPWVAPEQAMKKIVWTETDIDGGGLVDTQLPLPPDINGPYQDYPADPAIRLPDKASSIEGARHNTEEPQPLPTLYQDQVVFAYKLPEPAAALASAAPSFEGPAGPLEAGMLTDHRYSDAVFLDVVDSGTAITISYPSPVTVDSATLGMRHHLPSGYIEALGPDGWRRLAELPGVNHEWINVHARTFAFAPVTASAYRLVFTSAPPPPPFAYLIGAGLPDRFALSELRLGVGGIHRAQDKAGFGLLYDYAAAATPERAASVSHTDVLDLTAAMDTDGHLRWQAPEGTWRIVRLGYSLTGRQNHPAPNEGRGFEVDKLNAEHVGAYLDGYLAPLDPAIIGDGGIEFLLLDSWEAAVANWTQGMLEAFEERRGYDPRPFLPTLTGMVVDSAEVTEAFLWDWRSVLGEMLRDNHNRVVQSYANKRGMGVYAESMGTRMPTLGDGMAMKADAEVPMAEFWYVPTGDPRGELDARYVTDIREAASVAEAYGQKLVAAEAFTTLPIYPPWGQGPRDQKFVADFYLAQGVNRFVIHSSDHQPLDGAAPGLTLWEFGQFLTRHETWAEDAEAWMDYMARTSFMLQQGDHVADVAIFLGEGAPLSVPFWDEREPGLPDGYDYGYVNADLLLSGLDVKDGRLTTPGGAEFSLLVIPERVTRLTAEAMERLAALAEAGAAILVPPLGASPSLSEADDASRLQAARERLFAAPRVIRGTDAGSALETLGIKPDVAGASDDQLVWRHRRGAFGDLYFVANLATEGKTADLDLGAAGPFASLFYPEDGRIVRAEAKAEDGRTKIRVDLDPQQSVFVVLTAAAVPEVADPLGALEEVATLADFTASSDGATPAPSGLGRWDLSENVALRYHSGTISYATTIDVSPEQAAAQLFLDLGEVHQTARVYVNGKLAGIDVFPPYRVEVTGLLSSGENDVVIEVTNLWANRLIGDAGLPASETVSATGFRPYTNETVYARVSGMTSDHPLFPSGLVGPVSLLASVR